MPGGGLLALVSYGSQNVILNGNPEFTYFYKVFKRYSHFAIENTTIPLDGPNQLFYDQNIKLRAKIPRVADLVTDMTLAFDLPDIYSKYDNTRTAQYEFQWNDFVGANIINDISFYVGGSKIQEFDGDYMIAKSYADLDEDSLYKWKYLVGSVPELTDSSNGLYSGGSSGSRYPTVVPQPNTPQQNNRPSILGRTIYVPLPLWFSESIKKSLPLVALQYHECEIQITLRPIEQLYSILDPSGYRVRPGYRVLASERNISIGQPTYIADTDLKAQFRYFLTDIGCGIPALNNWYINPRLQASYVYLTQAERTVFASTPLHYLVTQVTAIKSQNIYMRTTIDLEIGNPVTRLLLVPRRSDSYLYRNQVHNYTNWVNPMKAPWLATPGAPNLQNVLVSSGLLIPNAQISIINSLRVILDGNEFQEEKPVTFYTSLQQYRNIIGGSTVQSRFLPIVNFSLTSPNDQPSGSINASRIRMFQIDVNPWALPTNPSYVYELITYVENINFFVVESGYGGIKYAL